MGSSYQFLGYNITTDPNFQNERYGNSPELRKQIETLFFEAQDKKNKKIIDKLTNLIIQYPQSAQLKNFLSVAYSVQGKYEKANEVNRWMLTEHPDYLFGKLNEANGYIEKGESEKVPSILGEAMEIKALYPDRDLFHLVEVTGFYKVAIRYYAAIGNLELAENRLKVLNEIAPEHPDTESAETFLFALRLQKGMERWKQEIKDRITPVKLPSNLPNQTNQPPKFNHSTIYDLYNVGLAISPQKIQEIIALPRATLIEDLENMLADTENRYDYFSNEVWEEETHNFVLHAVFLLNEINATESLPQIIRILENDEKFLKFWFGDHRTETLWRCFYGLGLNNLELLRQILLKPGVDTYIKSSVSEAINQMVLHHPEKRNEVLTVYLEVFTIFYDANLEDNLIDSDFLGLAIGDTIDCNLVELLPVIKQLYEKKYVSIGINGDYTEVEKEFKWQSKRNKKRKIYSIVDLYNHIITTWSGYRDDDDFYDDEDDDYDEDDEDDDYEEGDYPIIQKPTLRVEPKIGRNESCPCGSGKKYKKCHGAN